MKENQSHYFFPNLDGLRFFCFLSVFLFHGFYTDQAVIRDDAVYGFFKSFLFANGNLGVNFFFVLSGFLITFLLLKEKEAYGRIDIVMFWKRRMLRIWPLFYFCVFFGFIIFPWLKTLSGITPSESASPAYYVFFINNFDLIRNGLPDASVLSVLWSVAIEEQFYFVWPLLIFIIPFRYLPLLFWFLISVSLLYRWTNAAQPYIEFHTFFCMGDLVVGAVGGWLVQRDSFVNFVRDLPRLFILLLYAMVSSVFLFRGVIAGMGHGMESIVPLVTSLLFLMVILEQNYSSRSFFKLGRFKVVSDLGVISYGLYCLHFIGILCTTQLMKALHWDRYLWQVVGLQTVLSLAITILLAKLSFMYFEKPFLNLKHKLTRIASGR